MDQSCFWLSAEQFARHYNSTWMVAKHGYKTTSQVRTEQCAVETTMAAEILLAA